MRKHLIFIFAGLALVLLSSGCNSSSSTSKAVPSDALTGDSTLFPNNHLLASAQYLLDNGASNAAVSSANTTPIIIDTRSADAYASGHIPGAINTEWDDYVLWNDPPEKATLKNVADLEEDLSALGVTRDAEIVIYDDTLTSWGSSGRIFWMLEYLGCTNVKILNGGWDKWEADDLPIQTSAVSLSPAVFTAQVDASINSDKAAIANRLGDDDFVTVDTRTDEEYNGWLLYNEARGGHIPGAVQLPYAWYFNEDYSILSYEDLTRLLESKGVTADKEIVPYCTAGVRSGFFYFLGRLLDYPRISNYDASMWDWAAADSADYPMDKLENYEKLIYPAWLEDEMTTNSSLVIVETGWGAAGDTYTNGHIPGAVWVNTDEIEYDCFNARDEWPVDAGDPPCWDRSTTEEEDLAKGLTSADSLPQNFWNIYPDEYLLPAIAYMGIDKNTTVVVYGKSGSAAARVVWTLMYAGVADVRLLNGGKQAWTDAGLELETAVVARTPVSEFDPDEPGRTTALNPQYKVDIPYIREVVNGVRENAVIVDIRALDEYEGKSAPYKYIPTDGRVPGAVWGRDTEEYEDEADGSMRSYDEIKAFWDILGATSDNELSFYCGTGWRSSVGWFYAYLMGYSENGNFDSGWYEWSMGEGSAYAGADPVLNPIVDDDPYLP